MPKILLISHAPTLGTGYGRVIRRVADAFHATGTEITVVGFGYRDQPHDLPYTVLPSPQRLAAPLVAKAIEQFKPDTLFTLGDPWMFDFLPSLAQRQGRKWIAYFPVDGYPLPPAWSALINSVDVPVVFSHFTQQLVAQHTGMTPKLIYHGVDTTVFLPQDKKQAKEKANVSGHFVVGTVARNQQRKNLPALIKAFARFAKNKPDALLYLHTQLQGEWDIPRLVDDFGIEPKTRITGDLDRAHGIEDSLLVTLYNAMDVFVLPTMAEGFGLPIMESQACGVPALATNYSACPELLPDPIQRLAVKDMLIMSNNIEQAIVDVDDIVKKLNYFYTHRFELMTLGQKCQRFAQQFDWNQICRQFLDLLGLSPKEPPVEQPAQS